MVAIDAADQDIAKYKLIIVGDSNVGKTSIIKQYCDHVYHEPCRANYGVDFKKKYIKHFDEDIELRIWDTAGQERFRHLMISYYRRAHGIFIVYDITNENSLVNLDGWIKDVFDYAPEDAVKFLVGSKSDAEQQRMVSTQDGKTIAEHYGIQFFEVSSKTNTVIEEMFSKMVSYISRPIALQGQYETVKWQGNKDIVVLHEDPPVPEDSNVSKGKCSC